MPLSADIDTAIDLDATPDRVWEVLADLPGYAEWNPFIVSASGSVERGARLDIRLRDAGGTERRFRPRVLAAEPGRELRWLGRLGLPGLFDGEHALVLTPLEGERTRLRHTERMRGLLVPPLRSKLARDVVPGFEAMNTALAARLASRRATERV